MENNNNDENTLHLKKQVHEKFVYHYKRDEYPRDKPKEKPRGLKGLFKNKALLLILCDIILIILIYNFIQSPLIDKINKKKKSDKTVAYIDDYCLILRGFRIRDKVFARLYIENTGTSSIISPGEAKVTFTMEDKVTVISENLPAGNISDNESKEVKIETTLVCPDESEELSARVQINNKSKTLVMVPLER